MAKRKFLTGIGRRRLRGTRVNVRRNRLQQPSPTQFDPIFVNGKLLNIPESRIYRALQDLKIPFQTQVVGGGGRTLGGAIVDFLILQPRVALEYQGPFHRTDTGKVRDFMRTVNRKRLFGVPTVYLYQHDLDRIHERLREIIGQSLTAAMMTRR